ncbi:hypothetical protein Bca52824_017951 [Brassica carinata]|uniref:Uncharacterized protein n=1 Tax=Brassica carinata TaxID=52824 RepID=A0A8X8AVX3_BRACI|nr:hypothetical protein Bca52824_017951 [Brassica carinata]
MSGEEKMLFYVRHPGVTSHTSILTSSMEHCGLVLILKSMLLSEQHGRETTVGRGHPGTSFHLRRRISGGMCSFNTTTGMTNSTAASNAKRYLLNQEYIKRGKTNKGTVYGLGSVQYKNSSASVPIPVSLKRNLDVDMRMSGFETSITEVKEDIAGVKEDFSALKTEINAFKTEVTGGGGCQQAKQLST